ncbi:hypothetical protein AMTRI_Chr07g23750 [Amborella trichopoda]|uniref:Protein kinase domain-containing protein n=1 Tax=Amborella trichopoda TaxID=13333 RepID=W1PL27_AMBTC|nr:receptor-like serine/threonine-protein kinase NCRK [Amborella trichopoda]XP_020524356.1 receptor-like serine/threonine-protein kinase NCRK [Amborella trichopoda]XP_020524357.1 receptor-like serine/threonine-protein kinase NCRK [Amborella trichopoda]XP_020524358.1 receptor-like serine/threonine-protein kinase NCRK [Amborella trichopoda]XP_020524359.1 receptor-like serine/threonine-protein kinase NCRK [Amborella trichopoda]XP_020524360.1 receptor-like serine/threonine-protein kinase NCRK [Amb|eukprot:XP_006846805.1 receptor-like serine/threonine-protein kinase NCRK [Amborella trichopoda]
MNNALACLVVVLLIQCKLISGSNISSTNENEDQPEGSAMEKWTCSCASSSVGGQSFGFGTNCSTACNCTPGEPSMAADGRPSIITWSCICAYEGIIRSQSYIHDSSCFSSCNCTSGKMNTSKDSKHHISSKVFIATLVLCAVVTTIVLLASLIFYIRHKDKYSIQSPIFSTGKDGSSNSFTNLLSHRSTGTSEVQLHYNSCFDPISGCIHRASFMFRGKKDTLPGMVTQFSYSELEQATNKFSNDNIIGLGGSSNVYYGQLKDGKTVAIKRLIARKGSDAEVGFLTEIELISRLHHLHIVPLIGYCLESRGRLAERLQVYEYMPKGNLRDNLDRGDGKEPLDWVTRVSIALGAAKGLEYLHEAAAPKILHRDVKSSNILLDCNRKAKITDLGMAKGISTDDHHSCPNSPARMLGTFGYFAPEYAITGKASLKSDVFSYGVVLLELISGRPPIDASAKQGQESLVLWATPLLQQSKRVLSELVDRSLEGKFEEEELLIMASLARECLNWEPGSRPSMAEVVHILSTISPDYNLKRSFPSSYYQSAHFNTGGSQWLHDLVSSEKAGTPKLTKASSERWSSNRQSLPLTLEKAIMCKEDEKKEVLAAGYVERLVLLTSRARSWRSVEGESAVDLTEPRFESFWQANVQSL